MTVIVKRRVVAGRVPVASTALVHKQSCSEPTSASTQWEPLLDSRSSLGARSALLKAFWDDLPPCADPRVHYSTDSATGEMIAVPNRWPDKHGEIHIDGCGRNSCPVCVVMNARRIAHAVCLAEPTYSFGLTQVGNDAADIKSRITDWEKRVRKEIPGFSCVWAAEPNPEGTGNHAHGHAHLGASDRVNPRKIMSASLQPSGLGRQWKLQRPPVDAGAQWFSYPMKGLADPELAPLILELNGRPDRHQLIHASRKGFWRDGASGPVLSNRREAESLWSSRAGGSH